MEIGIQSTVFGKKIPFKEIIPRIKELGVDFVEIKPTYHPDTRIVHSINGTVNFSRAIFDYIAEHCNGLPFQFHLSSRMRKKLYHISTGEDKEVNLILGYAEVLSSYNPDFVLPLHADVRAEGIDITEEQGMENARRVLDKICEQWHFRGKMAIETMPEPGAYKDDMASLGYKPENLAKLVEGRKGIVGVCIDTGHINKGLNNRYTFDDFAALPVYEMHLHGNFSHIGDIDDFHILPDEETLHDYESIMTFLKTYDNKLNLETTLKEVEGKPKYNSQAELERKIQELRSLN